MRAVCTLTRGKVLRFKLDSSGSDNGKKALWTLHQPITERNTDFLARTICRGWLSQQSGFDVQAAMTLLPPVFSTCAKQATSCWSSCSFCKACWQIEKDVVQIRGMSYVPSWTWCRGRVEVDHLSLASNSAHAALEDSCSSTFSCSCILKCCLQHQVPIV